MYSNPKQDAEKCETRMVLLDDTVDGRNPAPVGINGLSPEKKEHENYHVS